MKRGRRLTNGRKGHRENVYPNRTYVLVNQKIRRNVKSTMFFLPLYPPSQFDAFLLSGDTYSEHDSVLAGTIIVSMINGLERLKVPRFWED